MSMTYAGVRLGLLDDDYRDYIEQFQRFDDFTETDLWGYAAVGIDHLPLSSVPLPQPTRVGTLVWPSSINRCGYAHYLIDLEGLTQIRTALDNTAGPAILTLQTVNGTVSVEMYLVACRPISQIVGSTNQSYVITLADRRYWLRTKTGSITTTPDSWSDLLSGLASALGITLTVDTIDAAYGSPTDRWVVYGKPLSVLIDAACNAVSQRIVANLDGTFSTVNYSTTVTVATAQYASVHKCVGGVISSDVLTTSVPESVTVLFANSSSPEPFSVTVSLSDLSIVAYGASTGVTGEQDSINGELLYDGTNTAACEAYATKVVTDWYNWNLLNLDFTAAGIINWTPTGAEDRIEWTYENTQKQVTRVLRPPFQILPFGGFVVSSDSPTVEPDPIVRIISVTDGTGEYTHRYSVQQVKVVVTGSSKSVDDVVPSVFYDDVVELDDLLLPVSVSAGPEAGVYRLGTAPDGQKYIVGERSIGCHLTHTEDGDLDVDLSSLAGVGLAITEDECPKLEVNVGSGLTVVDGAITVATGCGLDIDVDGKVAVDVSSLAGSGLTTTGDTCPKLKVDQSSLNTLLFGSSLIYGLTLISVGGGVEVIGVDVGCGLDIDDDGAVALNLTDVVGNGLEWDNDTCQLTMDVGCGLFLGEGVQIDYDSVAGIQAVSGLVKLAGSPCDSLGVDLVSASTETETLLNDSKIAMVGGKLRQTITKTTYTNHYNLAGDFISRVTGTPTTSYTEVDPCLFAECCDADPPTVSAGGTTTTTINTNDALTATPTGGTGTLTYSWVITGSPTYTTGSSTSQNPTVQWATAGSYTATVTVTDDCGNTGSNSIGVTVTAPVTPGNGCDSAALLVVDTEYDFISDPANAHQWIYWNLTPSTQYHLTYTGLGVDIVPAGPSILGGASCNPSGIASFPVDGHTTSGCVTFTTDSSGRTWLDVGNGFHVTESWSVKMEAGACP